MTVHPSHPSNPSRPIKLGLRPRFRKGYQNKNAHTQIQTCDLTERNTVVFVLNTPPLVKSQIFHEGGGDLKRIQR